MWPIEDLQEAAHQDPDFFNVEKFPTMTFKSTKIEKKGKDLILTGDLTMKGVTKSVSFPFNVAGFLNDHRFAGSDVLPDDVVWIVQCRERDRGTCNDRRFEYCERRGRARGRR